MPKIRNHYMIDQTDDIWIRKHIPAQLRSFFIREALTPFIKKMKEDKVLLRSFIKNNSRQYEK